MARPFCRSFPAWASLLPSSPWLSPLLSLAGLIDRQRPSPQHLPVQPVNRGLCLGDMGHLDKAKAARTPGVAIRDNPDALDDAVRCKQLVQLVFRRCPRQITDKNLHGSLLLCSSLSSTPCLSITAGGFSPCP